MIELQLEVLAKDPLDDSKIIAGRVEIHEEGEAIQLSPQHLLALEPKLGGYANIYGITGYILCKDAMVEIYDFKYISLEAYHNSSPSLSFMKIVNAKDSCTLSDLNIKRLDINKSQLTLVDCELYHVNCGIHEFISSKKNVAINEFDINIVDSDLKELKVFMPYKELKVQNTYIRRMLFEEQAKVAEVSIKENSFISRLSLLSKVEVFKVKNSVISDFEFKPGSCISTTEFIAYSINRIYSCNMESIEHKDMEAWKLIMESARLDDNGELYSRAGFEYMKCQRKMLPHGIQKLGYSIIELTSGYGFMPSFTIRLGVLTWLFFSIAYWLLTVFHSGIGYLTYKGVVHQKMSTIGALFNSLYYSAVTFTTMGYGDLVPKSLAAKFFASIEPVMGSVLMALLIFSLTKRYGSLK